MVKQAPVEPALAATVGEQNVRRGAPDYAVDGVVPESVVTPGSYDQVAAVLGHANKAGLAVIPLGGRNQVSIGNLPLRYDLALDLTRLNSVIEFEPADLTITCQAGIALGRLREATAEAGLRVPFDPSLPYSATVGGVLAANMGGPARMSLGAPRDFTIGMRVVAADGLLTRAGGKVVKNVAGYDLCKLYIGSLGTLGVIVEATFKTIPLPLAEDSLTFSFTDSSEACGVANDAYKRGLTLESAVITRQRAGWRLSVRLAGTPAAVERSRRELQAIAGSTADTAGEAPPPVVSPVVARFVTTPTKLPALLDRLATGYPDASVEAYPTLGVCRVSSPDGDSTPLVKLAEQLAASCTFECLPAEAKREIDVFGAPPSSFGLMRALKREFDPTGILSPGRMVGRL